MRLNNVHGFGSIGKYVDYKINKYAAMEKSFDSLFELMFDETDNIMIESSKGYSFRKITYGEYKQKILSITPTVAELLRDCPHGEAVGLYMSNSTDWLAVFWAILAAGHSVLIMNTRLSDTVLEGVLSDCKIGFVISDGKRFSVKTFTVDEVLVPSEAAYTPCPFGTEVVFMSSGTTDKVKLCAYTGENFYYQVLDSARIIKECPKIKRHYEGELKQLVLLPLCHVFGFIAVYLWFGFFSRTFVFPSDLNPDTIQRTVKRHKVTHIFAVPMVWEKVYSAASRKIAQRGEKTVRKFNFVTRAVNRLGPIGDFLAKKLLSEVRDGLFGDSICFLITGGSNISHEAVRFFNGIGYHFVNGYGMTEIGITSVEKSAKKRIVNTASIGAPFGYTEYSISESGHLLVRGKTRAARIMQAGISHPTDYDEWFDTDDIMRCERGRYYFDGRSDDLIVLDDGENLNPVILERQFRTEGADGVCLFRHGDGVTLLVSLSPSSAIDPSAVYGSLLPLISEARLEGAVKKILFTSEPLLRPGEFKLNRKKMAARVDTGEIPTFDPREGERVVVAPKQGIESEIVSCFAQALGRDLSAVGVDDDFFRDLGGTSLDYFALLAIIKSRTGVDILKSDGARITTVRGFVEHIEVAN